MTWDGRVTGDELPSDGYPADMTDQVDEGAARERLVRERDRVGELISELRSEGLDEEESAQSGDLTHYDQHPADQGSEMFEREKDLAILEALEGDLAEIEAALARLDDGTYGIDEVTGEPIDPERLDALPTARTNVPQADIRPADGS
jgi:RNA polymerase-binding transcription factor DksA